MIKSFIRFTIVAIALLSTTPVPAQFDSFYGEYYIQHYTDENGLPQNSINDLLFDNDGFLWLGSQAGVVRYDGRIFKLYDPADKPAMESNVLFLSTDSTGNIYFQTDDHSLYCYKGRNSQSLTSVNTPALRNPLLLNSRQQLFDFNDFLHKCSGTVESEKRNAVYKDLSSHNGNFYVIDAGHVYLNYNNALYYYDDRTLIKLDDSPDPEWKYLILDKKLYVVKKRTVVSVYENGQKINGGDMIRGDLLQVAGKSKQVPGSFRVFPGEANFILADNRLYQVTRGSDKNLITRYLLDIGFVNNISGIAYNAMLDLLVISTETDGFYFLRKSKFQLPDFPAPLKQQLSQYSFGPLALHNGEDVLTERFIFDARGKFSLFKNSSPTWQRCLFIDKSKNIWSAVYNLPRKLTADMKPAQVFPPLDGQIIDYEEDAQGTLYCLTEKSLWRQETDGFRRVFNKDSLSPKGSNESFRQVSPHTFWIATFSGLIEYDIRTGQVRLITALGAAHVRSIYKSRDGDIFLGTYGQGIYYFHRGRFFKMPLDKNGFLITAHCFLEDNKGAIWIPCNKGLFKVPKADLDSWCDSTRNQVYYYYFGKQDGLKTDEFNGGFNESGLITKAGFVSLLSMKGMVCFYADSIKSNFPIGRIDITHMEINGKAAGLKDSIELESDFNRLALEVSCPFLGNRHNLYLEYALKGLNNEWLEVPEDGKIIFTRLAPGNYTLQIRKVNGFGRNNYLYRKLYISVIPHFYQTTWFVLLSAIALLGLLILLVQLRLTLKEKQKELRLKAEKLKGAVVTLEETVEQLQQFQKAMLQNNKMREKLISLVIHDLRSPLRFLTMLAGDLHDNQDKFSGQEIKERTYWIKKGSNDIHNFSEDFLLWVTSQKNNFRISKRPFPVNPLLREIHDFFREQVQQKGNSIVCDAAEELTIYSDPHILLTIIRNLVDNANKYTDQGKITISVYEEDAHFVISVADTGKGMTQQQIDAFMQNETFDGIKSGSQLGHKFVFDLTKRINGSVSIESREKLGTTVKLRFSKEE